MTKPSLGTAVHYYDPKIPQRMGYGSGYGGRQEGPYHGVVINDIGLGITVQVSFPEMAHPIQFKAVRQKDEDGPKESPYWDWARPTDKMRAVKAEQEALKAVTEVTA